MKKIVIFLMAISLVFASEAKNFVLNEITGKKIHIEINKSGVKVKEFPKKIIILDFFGKNCPPCRAEMPILGEIQSKYKKDLQIIGVHVQEPLTIKDYSIIKNRGVNFPVVDYMQNQDFVEYISNLTGWQGMIPYMLFFDKNGTYEGYHLGMMEEETLEKIIEKIKKR